MAFFKGGKKKKKAKEVMIGVLIMGVISTGVIVLLYMQHSKIVTQYKSEITELQRVFDEETQTVVKVKEPIKAGQKFDLKKLEVIMAPGFIIPDNAVADIAELDNQIAKLDIEANTAILDTMLVDESIPGNVREIELNMLLLPSNLTNNHYMDVRISFPTGEEYVVLSKKKVRDLYLKENTTWLWLDERELLKLSSSIIDAYLNEGSKLYCVTYVDPMFQEKSVPNYPENLSVMKLIQNNPNILDEATDQLAADVRTSLEQRLNGVSIANMNKIRGNIVNEKAKRNVQIDEALEMQQETIDNTTEEPDKVFNRD